MLQRLKQNLAEKIASIAPAAAPKYRGVLTAIAKDARVHGSFYELKSFAENEAYQAIRKRWSKEDRLEFVVYLIRVRASYLARQQNSYFVNRVLERTLTALMATKLIYNRKSVLSLGNALLSNRIGWNKSIYEWPVASFLRQLERWYGKDYSPSPEARAMLQQFSKRLKNDEIPYGGTAAQIRCLNRLAALLKEPAEQPTFHLLEGKDKIGAAINVLIAVNWPQGNGYALLHHACRASAGQPSKGWLKTAGELRQAAGTERCDSFLREIISLLQKTEAYQPGWEPFYYNSPSLVDTANRDTIKGLLWFTALSDEPTISRELAVLAQKCYRKVPNKGPLEMALGNACVQALAKMSGLHGISQLSGLRHRVKQTSVIKKIDTILQCAAAEKGISRQEIEDYAVNDYPLDGGRYERTIGEYTAILDLEKPGKCRLHWKRGKKEQKSIPKAIKEGFAEELKALKRYKKELETDSMNLRNRLDWCLRLDREMKVAYFQQQWMQNGLLRYFAERLIWSVKREGSNESITVIRTANGWETFTGMAINIADFTTIKLWHPALSSAQTVEAWRAYLLEREIQQPFKQAYREVYILTAAEENTRSYSNRMAAHILKQHQFATLARGRGWSYQLIGAWDHGLQSQACYQELEELNLRAEYIILEMDAGDDWMNEVGIWKYITTDQVRFLDKDQGTVLDLAEVPPLAFSECMRDVDLFVGVSSIGNDDQWTDSGGEVVRDYWQRYTTRDLTAMGQNRKLILEQLIPRLKIRDVATVEEKYLVVKGQLRTYKIHIGSGNILMSPNDQYLCIVPGTYDKKNAAAGRYYLPFEGDRTLSIILSKAFLLAADKEIKDPTITRQIRLGKLMGWLG